jgi:hypothetical protein
VAAGGRSQKQKPDVGAATAGSRTGDNEPRVIQSVAGATTDSSGSSDGSVAGANTQICYQGETPEENPLQATSGNFDTAPPCFGRGKLETPRGPGAKSFGPWLRAERVARGIDPQIIADALRVNLEALALMEAGRAEMPASQRRRAEAALAKTTS